MPDAKKKIETATATASSKNVESPQVSPKAIRDESLIQATDGSKNAREVNSSLKTDSTPATNDTSIRTSSYLLLRLFTSEFFNPWLAVSYLFRYPYSPGIQHYLCNELRKFPLSEIEFFLPQLVHLLLSRPNESVALESLLLDVSTRSSHIAILFYWHLNTYFHDMNANPRTASFKLCQRIMNQLQLLLFVDEAPDLLCDAPTPARNAFIRMAQSTKSKLSSLLSTKLDWRKAVSFQLAPTVRENTVAAMVGIGAMMAGVGSPALSQNAGALAIAQGRRAKIVETAGADPDICIQGHPKRPYRKNLDGNRTIADVKAQNSPGLDTPARESTDTDIADQGAGGDDGDLRSRSKPPSIRSKTVIGDRLAPHPNFESDSEVSLRHSQLSVGEGGNGSSRPREYWDKTTKNIQMKSRNISRKLSRTIDGTKSLFSSPSPSYISEADLCKEYKNLYIPEVCNYLADQKKWLAYRSSYFQNEIKFMTELMDISRRVCLVPQPSRQNSLKAELAFFNHSLKDDMCIPLWCSNDNNSMKHQRIVRIPLDDVVVLNSAERAPYLLMLEVIEADPNEEYRPEVPKSPSSKQGVNERPKSLDTSYIEHNSNIDTGDATKEYGTQGTRKTSRPKIQPLSQVFNTNSDSKQKERTSTDAKENNEPTKDNNPMSEPRKSQEPEKEHDPELDTLLEVFGDINDTGEDILGSSPVSQDPVNAPLHSAPSGTSESNKPNLTNSGKDRGGYASRVPQSQMLTSRPSVGGESTPTNSRFGSSHGKAKPDVYAELKSAPIAHSRFANRDSGIDSDTDVGPKSEEEIAERMRTAAMLLAQLARAQKGIKQGYAASLLSVATPNPAIAATAPSTDTTNASTNDSLSALTSMSLDKKTRRAGNSPAETFERIRDKLIQEMIKLENQRFKLQQERAKNAGSGVSIGPGVEPGASPAALETVEYKDDPSAKVLKEDWEQKKARIRKSSPYGHDPRWNLASVIVKEGADLRQEQLALQLLKEMGRIWAIEKVPVFVRYFRIMVTGEQSGLVETITNTISIHSLKKDYYNRNQPIVKGTPPYTLLDYFKAEYGEDVESDNFKKAQDNFMKSLVAYSIATYILQLRDRHNGNILLDTEGHLIHIDFGFMLSNSPGSVGFEAAPFKLPLEYVELLGGFESEKWKEFKALFKQAFSVLRKYVDNFCLLVEMMLKDSKLPCLASGPAVVTSLRERFQLVMTEKQIDEFVERLLLSSCDNITTRMYDLFQYYSNGIL
ncbi:Phosphatidylinositol 4-kinase pik1alpha (PI4-kinase)(PtdIns-4-kinase) [Mycoemilia scoparia]|uniref:1-phosphatidylinositol 4-kinase n=1 Tax=Mycoemilia scoparia TaxID=417184 RepID=A0A9W7ZYA3_9FUNG|nr:Phosphatidylinositol 4-kinase pik1alpha (PI4-kinase)(PtdIns-4-kinase) [Mycoemilia scoparia]